ncbi:unnamed protein product [Diamesa serratosioi]
MEELEWVTSRNHKTDEDEDRVRICDTRSSNGSESIYGGASSQKSGWRQKSLSNIDLSSNAKFLPGAGIFSYKDFEAHPFDLCSNTHSKSKDNELQQDYEDICNVNPKVAALTSTEQRAHDFFNNTENPACSLRRSRSLAVIREETFNDLSITNAKTRRSQLIPRAKLVDRNFFKDRYNFVFDDGSSILDSSIDNQDISSQYSNIKSYTSPQPWHCDRSDLDSIDSSIFKHSLHQTALERSNSDSRTLTSRADIHSDLKSYEIQLDKLKSLSNATTLETEPWKRSGSNFSIREEGGGESGITIIEIKDKKSKHHNTTSATSVISYDSIYLSSESDKQTILNGEDLRESPYLHGLEIVDFNNFVQELNVDVDCEKAESAIDNLYSQVTKNKPKIVASEAKLSAETLTIDQTAQHLLTQLETNADYQYSSLPDADISKLLRDCELLDDTLRLACDESIKELEPKPDYDSICDEYTNKQSDNSLNNTTKVQSTQEALNNITKVFLPDIGIEFDYENSIASFDSDSAVSISPTLFATPSFNLVTVGGRQVIVDEIAAKALQKDKKKQQQQQQQLHNTYEEFDNKHMILPPSDIKKITLSKFTTYENTDTAAEKNCKSTVESKQHNNNNNNNINNKSEVKDKKVEVVLDLKNEIIRAFQLEHKDLSEIDKQLKVFEKFDKISYNNDSNNNNSTEMPRPQLLQIVDSKKNVCHVFPRQNSTVTNTSSSSSNTSNSREQSKENEPNFKATQKEFLHKVDSVRTYWSKFLDDESVLDKSVEEIGKLSFDQSSQTSYVTANTSASELNDPNDFQSFCPIVEIVEGQKSITTKQQQQHTTVVTTKNNDEVEFDHVRYKVIKSDMFQKNLMVQNHRKETQFDGLMQYLQDYSFQELLAHNNVVIIEPVRTKIEKPNEKPSKLITNACKITNGALNQSSGSKNLKKHFFYHPIRVNKELNEEELPIPDTVRNVRKLFEGTLRLPGAIKTTTDDSKMLSNSTRKKAIRYLTIDTTYGNNVGVRKWDSASLSSGISSGDLSSPCECANESYSEENTCDDEDVEYESHYVSKDVMEKIRECGSTVTYYGGRVVDKKHNLETQSMTKAIMKEIKQQKCNCQYQRRQQMPIPPADDKAIRKLSNDYLGMKFKLVKSNSCSSRLELAGTDLETKDNIESFKKMMNNRPNTPSPLIELNEQEESVRDMIYKLEGRSTSIPTKPRIIESKCIEKIQYVCGGGDGDGSGGRLKFELKEEPNIIEHEIAERLMLDDNIKTNNIVNNAQQQKAAFSDTVRKEHQTKLKIVRNVNVDLALQLVPNASNNNNNKPIKERENLARKASLSSSLLLLGASSKENINEDKLTKWHSIGKLESIEMVKNQDKWNQTNDTNNVLNNNNKIIIPPPALKSSNQSPLTSNKVSTKMVNWSTVGKLDKEYIANDRRLIETKKYDEMEFEQFEVLGEHYDSLNSK